MHNAYGSCARLSISSLNGVYSNKTTLESGLRFKITCKNSFWHLNYIGKLDKCNIDFAINHCYISKSKVLYLIGSNVNVQGVKKQTQSCKFKFGNNANV